MGAGQGSSGAVVLLSGLSPGLWACCLMCGDTRAGELSGCLPPCCRVATVMSQMHIVGQGVLQVTAHSGRGR